jgi:MFS family permease
MASISNPTGTADAANKAPRPGSITFGLIGFLFLLELTSGILQGFYIPLIPTLIKHLHIETASYNWFEAAQLLLSAIVVPFLAKLGDMYGHKRILLISTILTGLATWALPFADSFWPYLVAFALQGFYVVWLPLEVALIFDKGRRSGRSASQTRRAAGFLVVALELGAIAGALGGGRLIKAFHGNVELTLIVPAIAVTLVFFAILFGVPESEPLPGRSLDAAGFVILTLGLLLITGSLVFLRIAGPGAWWVWVAMAIGVLVFVPWTRLELRHRDPAVDIRVFRQPNMWPVQVTAGLVGISILGAQTPLATFSGANPKSGAGLGLDATDISNVIGVYLVALIIGAVLFPILANRTTPRIALIIAAFFVAAGYLDFLIFHATLTETLINMIVAGLGSGALVGALPSTAAAAAPRGQTGIATGLTNTTKTIGGSFASSTFAIVLASSAVQFLGHSTPTLGGYLTVFSICGCGALVAALLLFLVPKLAFADSLVDADPTPVPASPSA